MLYYKANKDSSARANHIKQVTITNTSACSAQQPQATMTNTNINKLISNDILFFLQQKYKVCL